MLNLARTTSARTCSRRWTNCSAENDIQFLKWDYNRNWSEPGWPQPSPGEQQENVCRPMCEHLYEILRGLRERPIRVEIQSCSGGGARVDLGIMG